MFCVGVSISSCTTFPKKYWPPPATHESHRQEIAVPFYAQEAFQCGPASLAMVLHWSGVSVTPGSVASKVFTPSKKGSFQSAIISAARRYGRVAYPIHGPEEMLLEVSAGHPVIVLQNLGLSWFPKWHYAVVSGYDLESGVIILHSGRTPAKNMALGVFDKTWARSERWGLLVLKPGDLPATAEKDRFLSAVLGLEKAKQWHAAVDGYRTALRRWPDSVAAHMGLGNSYYALGEKPAAADAYRLATIRFPTEGSSFNNLAHVLWEQGKPEEALTAARRAVELGGPLKDVFMKTLTHIEAQMGSVQDTTIDPAEAEAGTCPGHSR